MVGKFKLLLVEFYRFIFPFCLSFCCIRVYEYFTIASKSFVSPAYLYEFAGLLYDVWFVLIYGLLVFILYLAVLAIHKKTAMVLLHTLNVLLLIMYIGLLITYSERNVPFDHELFTRSLRDTWQTSKQMMTSGFGFYLPFIIFITLYFLSYYQFFLKKNISFKLARLMMVCSVFATVFNSYAAPRQQWFKQTSAYYFVSNKFSFWINDTYRYFKGQWKLHKKISDKELADAIDFYQANQPFNFTSKEYPLLHEDTLNDVLGNFFNLHNTPPNIVILVVEGLSRDFSGDNAYATSFTPFLDSLSKYSLVWNNFLSTAPGTFAAQPAITASVPYASRGFSLMNVMPEHLSLIKILRKNGYRANFMIGFNPDFDNMGGFIRLQGTDLILSEFPKRYKKMGVGEGGWSMGYPDDALFDYSLKIVDSLHQYPYLNIYHTATTHMPYLFEQKPKYDRLFDKKLQTLHVSAEIKNTLRQTKNVLVTFMFSDDCLRKFFSDYAKRPEYNNTIFFITGDHHIGSFPSTSGIDDYHVPFIVYSPMLKAPKKFLSINTHNSITPTILSLILKNYPLPYKPNQVHWLCGVIDTSASFRNIHSMPFMEWNRDITDYIYKDYYLTGDELYKLSPTLEEIPCNDDSMKNHITALRENFKVINRYVCENNKVFPEQLNATSLNRELLFERKEDAEKSFYSAHADDTSLLNDFKVPQGYKYLYAEVSGSFYSPLKGVDEHPSLRLALIDNKNNKRNFLYWSMRSFPEMGVSEFIPQQWNQFSTKDMFAVNQYKQYQQLFFNIGVWTDSIPLNFKIKELSVKIYGVK